MAAFRIPAICRGALALGVAVTLVSTALGENWPGWRGPNGVGTTAETELPITWSGKTGENVRWTARLPDSTGNSGPIVWGDRVFVTTAARQTQQQQERKEVPKHFLWCFAAADGKLLWKTEIASGKQPAGQDIYAAPTPVTDGKAVYCWFGSAVASAVDFEGRLLWRKEQPGPYNVNPGICSSPALFDDTVILLCDQPQDKGWLRALDRATGDVRWERQRTKRSHTNASPVVVRVGDKRQLIVQASDQLQGLDPASGETIWWCKSVGFGASPAFGGGLIYSDSGKDESAVVVDPSGKGDVSATHVKWERPKVLSQYQSAVICGERVFRACKPGLIKVADLQTGKDVLTQRAPGIATVNSPIATGDDIVYFASADKTYVIKNAAKPEVLAVNELGGGGNWSSAAVAGKCLFIRGDQALFCIGQKAVAEAKRESPIPN